jgi:hypothetical protein
MVLPSASKRSTEVDLQVLLSGSGRLHIIKDAKAYVPKDIKKKPSGKTMSAKKS